MAIKVITNDIERRLKAMRNQVILDQIKDLRALGEMCVTHAKGVAPPVGFYDHSGNLRSSIGFGVFVDGGLALKGGFQQVPPQAAHKDGIQYNGAKIGEEYCIQIGRETQGVCLVVVAGMNYATHVESKGRDVLTSAEHLAEQELPKMLKELIEDITKGTTRS